MNWSLECSACGVRSDAGGLKTVCDECGMPWLVRYSELPGREAMARLAGRDWNRWRYREWLPLEPDDGPVTLGEGMTPLLDLPELAEAMGVAQLLVKDESTNPTGSFKARGLSAAVTRATKNGASGFTVPTAGNAGVALSAYASRAGVPARIFAPRTTPPAILRQIETFGGDLVLVDGHIGDCGRQSRDYARETGAFDVSTLKEPYRIEGKKTLGLELAEQLHWQTPDAIIYPTGGGTGLIGMWKAFNELRDAGWIDGKLPRLYSVQTLGCAPVVRAFEAGADQTEPWPNPATVAAGLRVPAPLGGRLMLQVLRETGGGALAVSDEELDEQRKKVSRAAGLDLSPEGAATIAGLAGFLVRGIISPEERVIVFNTGAGWLYR